VCLGLCIRFEGPKPRIFWLNPKVVRRRYGISFNELSLSGVVDPIGNRLNEQQLNEKKNTQLNYKFIAIETAFVIK
jgi:hypothetical protein